jgi:hypothetical protein
LLQQSSLQINFPLNQQQLETTNNSTQEQQQIHQLDEQHNPAQGYFDESGNLCIVETLDGVIKESVVRYNSREKTRSSQKRRKKKRRVKRQEQTTAEASSTRKEFGK